MLALDADARPTCTEILKHDFFTRDSFDERFLQELRVMVLRENERKPLNRTSAKISADENASKKKLKKELSNRKVQYYFSTPMLCLSLLTYAELVQTAIHKL